MDGTSKIAGRAASAGTVSFSGIRDFGRDYSGVFRAIFFSVSLTNLRTNLGLSPVDIAVFESLAEILFFIGKVSVWCFDFLTGAVRGVFVYTGVLESCKGDFLAGIFEEQILFC